MGCTLFGVSPVAAVFMLFCACLTFVYILWVRSRIDFAVAHLEAAVDAVRAFPGLVVVGFALVAVQLLWVVFWALAALGLAHSAGSAGGAAGGLVVFVMLVSLYWGVQVFQNGKRVESSNAFLFASLDTLLPFTLRSFILQRCYSSLLLPSGTGGTQRIRRR